MERRLLTLFAETPVHAGGADSLAAVDLPIQREAATRLPVIWGQSLKGALRQAARDAGWSDDETVFGSRPPGAPTEDGGTGGELTKGAVAVGDAQLLLFPAATLRQIFAWATSPVLLGRLARKLRLLGVADTAALRVPPPDGYALGTTSWEGTQLVGQFLENVHSNDQMGRLGAALGRLACPSDAAFTDTLDKLSRDVLAVDADTMGGLSRMGTDVVARVQLDPDAKTVKHGPFYAEHLPAETVLVSLLAGTGVALERLTELLDNQPLQLGGDETVGKGVLWCRVHTVDSATEALTEAVPV